MVFQVCLLFVFNDHSGFEEYWSINLVFCRMCLSLDLSDVFLTVHSCGSRFGGNPEPCL